MKETYYERANDLFDGTSINVTSAGKRHLGAVIGSRDYKEEYVNNIVAKWTEELRIPAQIAEIQAQAAYSAYIHGFRGKFTYFIRKISDISNLLQPIEEVMQNEFIPAITGGHQCSNNDRALLGLPIRLGGLGLENVTQIAETEYESSRKITRSLV